MTIDPKNEFEDEFEAGMEAMRAEEEANARRYEAYRENARQEQLTMVVIGCALLLGAGGIGAWMPWGYLNTGEWPVTSLRTVTHWSFTSDMVGLQNIVNWFLDTSLGWYPLAGAILILSAGLNKETY